MDESNPHMHIIFLCVDGKKLLASTVVGYKSRLQGRLIDFYKEVGQKHGLERPLNGLNKANRKLLANKVIEHLEASQDPIVFSKHYQTVKDAIKRNPASFAFELDLNVVLMAQKFRTVAQIFTSKGKGSQSPDWA
jgi:hypothetical protein